MLSAALVLEAGAAAPAPVQGGRHALIVVVGNYGAGLPRLSGAAQDRDNALAIAQRLGIPEAHTTVLYEREASSEAIRSAASELALRTATSDQVLLYFSGLGSQRADQDRPGGCEETFLAQDGAHLGHGELASYLLPVAERAEKTLLFFDSCNRSPMQGGALPQRCVPAPAGAACGATAAGRWRGLVTELRKGSVPVPNIAALLAAPSTAGAEGARGGAFGSALAACIGGGADDSNRSGALSLAEIGACTQGQVDARTTSAARRALALDGNRDYAPLAASPGDGPATELLADIHAGRDGRRRVILETSRAAGGSAGVALSLRTDATGYLYLIATDAGGDFRVLYPTAEERDNRLRPGTSFSWPRSGGVQFARGTRILALVADNEHDLAPLLAPAARAARREALFRFAVTSVRANSAPCLASGSARNLSLARACSSAYGSALINLDTP